MLWKSLAITTSLALMVTPTIAMGAPAAPVLIEQSVDVGIGADRIALPLRLSVSGSGETVDVSVEVDISRALSSIGPVLEREIESQSKDCEIKFDAADGKGRVLGEALALEVRVDAQAWICKAFLKTKGIKDSATIHSTIDVSVVDGVPVLAATTKTRGLGDISKLFGAEKRIKHEVAKMISEVNREIAKLPELRMLLEGGFEFKEVAFLGGSPQRLRARLVGPNNLLTVLSILQRSRR